MTSHDDPISLIFATMKKQRGTISIVSTPVHVEMEVFRHFPLGFDVVEGQGGENWLDVQLKVEFVADHQNSVAHVLRGLGRWGSPLDHFSLCLGRVECEDVLGPLLRSGIENGTTS